MAHGIQVENGNFARIHNEISERLARTDLSGAEFRCLWFLLRKTYGFQKKEDTISYSQFAEGTGLDRRNVMRSLDKLVKRGIIRRRENGSNRPQIWNFNKYFEQWDCTSGQNDTSLLETSGQNDTSLLETSGQNDTSLLETSGQNDTKTSGQNDTHKRYKDIDHHHGDDENFLETLLKKAGFGSLDKNFDNIAHDLESRYSKEQLIRALESTKAAHQKKLGNGGKGVSAPLAYMASVLTDNIADNAPAIKRVVSGDIGINLATI